MKSPMKEKKPNPERDQGERVYKRRIVKCCYADAMKLMLLMRQEKRLTYIEAPASLYIRENRTFSLSHATIAKERSHHSSSSNLLPRANIPSISAPVASHLTLQCCAGMLVPSDQANYFQCEACQKLATLRRKQKKGPPADRCRRKQGYPASRVRKSQK